MSGTLRQQLEFCQQQLIEARQMTTKHFDESQVLKKRIAEIAAENESLRSDKKWLQQMHSAVLQSMHAFVSGRRVS